MSKNHHQHSLDFLQELLGYETKCPRNNCRGTLVPVVSRYEDHGPINIEKECTSCGKVKKDRYYAEQRRKRYEERKKNWGSKQGSENRNDQRK